MRSFIWATILSSLTLFAHAKTTTFETKTKCIYLDGEALCPGERRVLQSDQITIAAGFPPNSKSVPEWAPKWYETVWVPPTIPIWPFWELSDFYLGDDECVYTQVLFNPTGLVKCVNFKYTYGEKVPNPWNSLNYGPDGPVDYKDPQHFQHPGQDYINSHEYLGKEGLESEYDPEGKLPDSTSHTPAALVPFVHGTAESRAKNPVNRKPVRDIVVPHNPPPRLKDLIHPPTSHPSTPHSETDDPEQEAFASGSADDPTDGTDYSLFTTSPIADSGTPSTSGLFDGAANGGSDVTASLDPSIFENAGNLFNAANQADLTAFDPSSSSTTSNIASSDNNDWTSALLPGDGNSNTFTADNGGLFTDSLFAANNGGDMFTADNSGGKSTAGDDLFASGDVALLDPPAGSADDNLFAKRYQKTSPRDFRF